GAYAIGVDFSAASMALCRETRARVAAAPGRAAFVQADATRLPFGDESLDIVFMLDLVEHLHIDALHCVGRELARVLAPGGRLVIHTSPNRRYFDIGYRLRWQLHRAVLALPARLRGILFGEVPPLPLKDPRSAPGAGPEMHVNEMTARSLRRFLRECGLNGKVWLACDPPVYQGISPLRRWTWIHRLLDLWPLGKHAPLRMICSPHIFAVARRVPGRMP
ncbi:MAG: class I SAM-dependent methyltransferase, partial [Candidatus Aureabacteria bacterium]|nr:class I SAM-dependent methyltransferase [Candidatus Auribacterota bacterium]